MSVDKILAGTKNTGPIKSYMAYRLSALLLLALVFVTCMFPDVLFSGRTLQPSSLAAHMGRPDGWQAGSLFPLINPQAQVTDGFADLNASAWQFEPARYVMARNAREGQSPWWNPYSASGTLGPEVLVDVRFSPHTLLGAYLFDASPASFDYGLLLIYCIDIFLVMLLLQRFFGAGLLAAMTGAAAYLLNGFAVPNLNTHIGQPYFFAPVLLYAVLLFAERQTVFRWLVLVLAHALLLSVTILTTLILVMLTAHVLGIAYFLRSGMSGMAGSFCRYAGLVLLAGITALLLLGPLWFPVIDSFFVTDMASDFGSRTLQKPRSFDSLLSVFTPEHFWADRAGVPRVALYPAAGLERNESLISYLGITGSLLMACGVLAQDRRFSRITLTSFFMLVFSYARVFGLASFVDYVPVLRAIGNQYWGCMALLAASVLAASGVENIRRGTVRMLPVLAVMLLQVFAFVSLYRKTGFPDVAPYSHYVLIAVAVFLFACVMILVMYRQLVRQPLLAILCSVVVVLELFSYMNTLRPLRQDPLAQEPGFVAFVGENIRDGRILNIGHDRTLYPEYGAMFGIRQADTQNPGLFPWYERFFDRHFGNDTFLFLALDGSADRKRKKSSRKELTLDEQALDVASIKYVLVSDAAVSYLDFFRTRSYPQAYRAESVTIFENVNYLPSASLVPALVQSEDLLPDLDPASGAVSADDVLLEQARQLGIPERAVVSPVAAAAKAVILSAGNTVVEVETLSDSAAVLVLSDTWHPAWRVTVDGVPSHVGRVNEAFRGVVVPAGQHRVSFSYDPPALRYGIYATVAASLFLLLLLLFSLQRKGKQRRGNVHG